MRTLILAGLMAAFAGTLSGCGLLLGLQSEHNELLVSAEPLAIKVDQLQLAASLPNKREFLGTLVYDSEKKCVSFLNRLVLARNTVDTTGDILSAGLSAAGALVTPLSTAHALSGAATFVTGAKAAIDADIYAKASLSSFQTALQQSYFRNVLDYTNNLPNVSESSLIVSNEVAKIQSIHATCALGPAEATIQATIAPAKVIAPPLPPPPGVAIPAPGPLRRSLGTAPAPGPTIGAPTHGAVPGAPLF